MTAYSAVNREWERNACFDLYPMASLFKIVTASAALEARRITPETVVKFRGTSHSENPRYWDITPRGRNNTTNVTFAMGKSINPVYGRVAADIAGKDFVMQSVRKFGFNQTLLPGIPVKESRAAEPQGNHGLMLMGAGLDHEVKISPLHAAVVMAAIGNQGRLMNPILADRIVDAKGVVLFELTEVESGMYETTPSFTHYFLQTLAATNKERITDDLFGEWQFSRGGKAICQLTLANVAYDTDSFALTLKAGCDPLIARFAPVSWRLDRGQFVMLAANGQSWRFEENEENTWSRIPAARPPVLMVRPSAPQ
jgi:hypothetical protein